MGWAPLIVLEFCESQSLIFSKKISSVIMGALEDFDLSMSFMGLVIYRS